MVNLVRVKTGASPFLIMGSNPIPHPKINVMTEMRYNTWLFNLSNRINSVADNWHTSVSSSKKFYGEKHIYIPPVINEQAEICNGLCFEEQFLIRKRFKGINYYGEKNYYPYYNDIPFVTCEKTDISVGLLQQVCKQLPKNKNLLNFINKTFRYATEQC